MSTRKTLVSSYLIISSATLAVGFRPQKVEAHQVEGGFLVSWDEEVVCSQCGSKNAGTCHFTWHDKTCGEKCAPWCWGLTTRCPDCNEATTTYTWETPSVPAGKKKAFFITVVETFPGHIHCGPWGLVACPKGTSTTSVSGIVYEKELKCDKK